MTKHDLHYCVYRYSFFIGLKYETSCATPAVSSARRTTEESGGGSSSRHSAGGAPRGHTHQISQATQLEAIECKFSFII